MRILVTNDDGIHAPGLKIAEAIAKKLSKDIWIVAPDYEQSGASHSLTLTKPLRLRKVNARKYAVRGTPTDCVMMAVHEIMQQEGRPDLIISGVNRGSNLGEDVTYSGTVAAAMEGTLLGIPSIALSQKINPGHPVKWATGEQHAPGLIRKLLKQGWPKGVLININFPDVVSDAVEGVQIVTQGQRDLTDLTLDHRIDARGVPYYWIGFRHQNGKPKRGTDLRAVDEGYIAVTPLQLDLTHNASLKALRAALG